MIVASGMIRSAPHPKLKRGSSAFGAEASVRFWWWNERLKPTRCGQSLPASDCFYENDCSRSF